MRVKALKDFSSTTYGNVSAGDVLDMPDGLAKHNMAAGRVEAFQAPTYNTKVVHEIPTVAGVEVEPSSSPADQALPEKTPKVSKKKKSLQSTVQSD
jgi:hypothetical protein